MANERISQTQVLMLMVVSRVTLTLVYFPAMANRELKHDVWLASFLSALWVIPFVWVVSRLWKRFPGRSLPEVAEVVLGQGLGRLLALWYALDMVFMSSVNLRVTADFFASAFLPRTPIIVEVSVVAFLVAWAAKAGVEVMARAAQVIFPLLVGSILAIFVLLLKDIRVSNLQPVFISSGPVPVLKEAFNVVARTTEITWLGMLVPAADQQHRLFRSVAMAMLLVGVLWIPMGIATTGTMGLAAQRLAYPFFSASRNIEIADFLERVDAIVLSMWQFGMLIRCGMMLWAAALFTAHGLGLRDYRPLVTPLAGLAVTYAIAQVQSFPELRGYLSPETYTPFRLTVAWLTPMVLLTVAVIRGVRGPGNITTRAAGEPSHTGR